MRHRDRSLWSHPSATVPWLDPERLARIDVPFTSTRRFRLLIGAVAVVGSGLVVLLVEVAHPFSGPRPGETPARSPSAEAEPGRALPPAESGPPRLPFDGLLGGTGADPVRATPLEEQTAGYGAVLDFLTRHANGPVNGLVIGPPALPAPPVGMTTLRTSPAKFLGSTVRVQGFLLHSSPIRLDKPRGGIEWVHRTFLVDDGSEECCVIDLIERPKAAPRSLVRATGILVKLSLYDAVRGIVEVPHLMGSEAIGLEEASPSGGESR